MEIIPGLLKRISRLDVKLEECNKQLANVESRRRRATKVIICLIVVWVIIIFSLKPKEKPFAQAYRCDSKPLWTKSKIIFGSPLHEYADVINDELYAATPPTPDETVVLISNDEDNSSSVDNDSNRA
ncbi:hypothetical protein Salat_1864700 [Sesamum alatum]|uniref:Uncharacterized protein n=1 Tax=Sesamum alatum TaxID=300844 RepID=A0AAE2CHY8_9LAMI|nr:hypothetical protein Salat_1864700 [Sesamum alatum]